jgi:hypothetical protein
MGWKLDAPAVAQIDRVVTDCVRDPVGPEFTPPPPRRPPEAVSNRGWFDAHGDGARTRVEEPLLW